MGRVSSSSFSESAEESAGAEPSAMASRSAGAFTEGEKVLAYHCSRIYGAKIRKAELLEDKWKYFVHYLGWNKNWDEWVGADRLLKFTEENLLKQKELEKNQSSEKNLKSGRSAQNKLKSPNDVKLEKEDVKNNVAKGKKRKAGSSVEEKDTRPSEKLVTIPFPNTLKKQLLDDWEYVTQLGKLVKLPRRPNIDDILKKYLDYRTKKDGLIAESIGEILKGIRCYFDKALPALLLYKSEMEQYNDVVQDNVSPSTIYGAEHLLRLFVRLPELLAYVNMYEEALLKLQKKLSDFLKYLQKNQNSLFSSTYIGGKSDDDDDEDDI